MGRRKERPLRRTTRSRGERRAILVVTEGTVTEPGYLNGLKRRAGLTSVTVRAARLKVEGLGQDPQSVVDRAVLLAGQAGDDGYDSVWVAMDVDQHAGLDRALATARQSDVRVAVSNPCFELWLVLHLDDAGGHCDSARLRKRLAGHGFDGKKVPESFPWDEHEQATARAERLHPGADGRSAGPNPSTSVHLLVADVLASDPGSARR